MKKRSTRTGSSGGPKEEAVAKRRRGLPHPASVVSVGELVSPRGRRYRILRTDEQDADDNPPKDGRKP